jgi:hypothetical protein
MRKSPSNAPHGQGPFEPKSRSLSGIQTVRLATRKGKTEILTILTPDRLNQEFRNRLDGTRPIPEL